MAKHCYAIGGRINFNEYDIRLCHGIDIEDKIIWKYDCGEDFTPEFYLKKAEELDKLNQQEHPICEGCSNLIEGETKTDKIEVITFNTTGFCQNKCIYCNSFDGEVKEVYHPFPIIKEFMKAGLIADNCLFDWGGGEPVLSDNFEEMFLFLLEHGYMQRVNTNAVKLSNVVLNHLDENLVSLRISIDSGNADTFLATKGRDLFVQVVENIREYSQRTENIVLKYVITNSNSDKKSIEDFVKLAVGLGIKTICIDTEMISFGRRNYKGLLRFTEKELEAAHLLKKSAQEARLKVQIGYVWTAQNNKIPSRDFNNIRKISELHESNETYSIPENLYPLHIDKMKVYKNGIIPIVLAGFETLLHEISKKKVILYGAGKNCCQLYKYLRMYDINVIAVCDKHKQGQFFEGFCIQDIQEVLNKVDENTCMLITPYCAREIVIEFNENNYVQLKGKVYFIDSNRYSKKVLEDTGLVKDDSV